MLYPTELRAQKNGRGGRIRTYDFLLPKQALYQAELHPEQLTYGAPKVLWQESELKIS